MAATGKTGADAVFKAIDHICKVNARFGPRLRNVVVLTAAAELITGTQETALLGFLDGLSGLCAAWDAVATFSNLKP